MNCGVYGEWRERKEQWIGNRLHTEKTTPDNLDKYYWHPSTHLGELTRK